jgi:magnesium transporter
MKNINENNVNVLHNLVRERTILSKVQVVTIWAYFIQGNLAIAMAVGISLCAISLIASLAGSALPFLFRSLGLDPALMSAPFITTAVDVLGVLIYLNVARWILRL